MPKKQDSHQSSGMYSEWTSLSLIPDHCTDDNQSVLEKFGLPTSRDVTLGVVRQLASNLGISQPAERSPLVTDKEVHWCMEVLCFGLALPLSEHEAIKDCVNVYCEWLLALLHPKICVPQPIVDDPNLYARKIMGHLHYLFVPRKGEGIDTINRQAVLCHRVLRTLQQVAHESTILERDTWQALLLFLLAINDSLLAPPTVRDDVADQLCERVLGVLFEIWLIACAQCFPAPSLWRTLRESCLNWRHRVALIEQWNRINLVLASKLLAFMYGPGFPALRIGDEELLVAHDMSNDCIAQSYYRFFNTIGNPISLTKPEVISQTQMFLQYAIGAEISDPSQHPCLQTLPVIFLKAIKGIAGQVDAFLGIAQTVCWSNVIAGGSTVEIRSKEAALSSSTYSPTPTPPSQRRLAKSFSVAPSSSVAKGIPKSSLIGLTTSRSSAIASQPSSGPSSATSTASLTSFGAETKPPLAPSRANCNSILHLFGEWLFDAAFLGCDLQKKQNEAGKRPSSVLMESYSQPSSISDIPTSLPAVLALDRYESGKAEALGTLCRIMCAKKTGEEILPVYLARFYLAVQQGLKIPPNRECSEVMVAILMNSCDLFRLDLDGVRILLPVFISALEIVLPDKDLKLSANVSKVELRRASIQILSTILVLPLHFQNIVIKELISTGSNERPITFAQLKPRLMNLVMNALQIETDAQNTHMLLGSLFLCVQDSSIYEKIEQVVQPPTDTSSNLLSSASDTASTMSMASSYDRSTSPEPNFGTNDFFDFQIDSAHALFVRATYLVCHRLISSWNTDLNISLAALELLSGLARIQIRESDAMECKRAVKWLCDYIVQQCSRPPPAHSKDLHSTIVAAFQCCSVWLLKYPYLLRDKECLTTVLEVVELGVSGTKSVGKPGEEIKMKEQKQLKPASMRVRDAAENLLTIILEQVDSFPNECGPESTSSLLNELALLQHCNSWPTDCTDQQAAVARFRYFVTEGSVLLGLLEEPLGNDQDAQPTVTILIRGPFGRHSWTMQLRHLPRHRSGGKCHNSGPTGRPVVMQDAPACALVRQKYFPESVERVAPCRVDASIPSLDAVIRESAAAEGETGRLAGLLERQGAAEAALGSDHAVEECSPPPVCHDFQTSRLFLSHFGLLSLVDDEDEGGSSLVALDTSAAEFCRDLNQLDHLSARTCDTVHIFYVKSQQSNAGEIVANVRNGEGISGYFYEFIKALGWPVKVDKHPGWTGHVSTSWKVTSGGGGGGGLYDGSSEVLYWADACSELAFVIPSSLKPAESRSEFNMTYWYERSLSEAATTTARTQSLDADQQPVPPRRSAHRAHPHPHTNTKIVVAWLESYEDDLTLPLGELLPATHTGLERGQAARPGDALVVGLHPLASGLLRVRLRGPAGRVALASPLVDGMVASRRALGPLVRQTALNMARRRRLDSESYQPPHVRRRLKVQEVMQKYKREMGKAELLTFLFGAT